MGPEPAPAIRSAVFTSGGNANHDIAVAYPCAVELGVLAGPDETLPKSTAYAVIAASVCIGGGLLR
jgi:hypothetical protein